MKALVKYAPGKGNVAVREVKAPVPAADELLIKIRYCGICGTDLHIQADEFPNSPPVIMGHEWCGTVVRVGENAGPGWAEGQRVVGELHTGSCGTCYLCRAGKPHICEDKLALGSRHDGGLAEYLVLPASLAHHLPDGIPWEVAALTEPFAIAAHCLLERGRLGQERTLLITGAATMGLMSTIWARRAGVPQIVVAGTTADQSVRFPLAGALGATRVVNVQTESLGNIVRDVAGPDGMDACVECSGSAAAVTSCINLVKKTGKLVLIGLVGPATVPIPWNTLLYKELDVAGCFSSPPSSWETALATEREEAAHLRPLATHIIPLDAWEQGFAMTRNGEAVKVLVDLEA